MKAALVCAADGQRSQRLWVEKGINHRTPRLPFSYTLV